MPCRIQRQRTKGWRMPDGAVYVGRPTPLGNPFTVAAALEQCMARDEASARQVCVDVFREWLADRGDWWQGEESDKRKAAIRACLPALAGIDLVCWCPITSHGAYVHCHADVLLSIANDIPMEDVIRENSRRPKGEAL